MSTLCCYGDGKCCGLIVHHIEFTISDTILKVCLPLPLLFGMMQFLRAQPLFDAGQALDNCEITDL